jgi:hypothetical protein
MTRPHRLLLVALGWALSAPAWAAARLVVQVNEPGVKVAIDGRPVVATAGRVVANHLSAGAHALEFRGPDGQVAHAVTVMLADGDDARGRYTLASGLSVQGAAPPAQAAAVGPQTSPVAAAPPPPPPPADTTDPAASTFDMNEGGRGGVGSGPGDVQGPARGTYTAQRVASGVARGAAVVAAPNLVTVTAVGGAVAGGAASLARNAHAGGTRGWGSSPTPRQGRPTPPKADMGTITLVSTSGEPYTVYLDGFVIAEVGPGKPSQRVRLEVGRHLIELWDGDTNQVRWKGVAELTKDAKMTVQFSDAVAPASPDRSWAWSGRQL